MRISAFSDLAWYFGSFEAEAGLRSSIGGQMASMESGLSGSGCINIGAAEDQLIRALPHAHRARSIVRRLAALPQEMILRLSLSFTLNGMYGDIDGSAVILDEAITLVERCHRSEAKRLLKRAEAEPAKAIALERLAMHELWLADRCITSVGHKVLEEALRHKATQAELDAIKSESDRKLLLAMRAYEHAEPVQQISERVQR